MTTQTIICSPTMLLSIVALAAVGGKGQMQPETLPQDLSVLSHQQLGSGFTFVTGANRIVGETFDHSCTLLLLLKSLNVTYPRARVIVYDLGVDSDVQLDINEMRMVFPGNLILRSFDYSKYETYMKINEPSAGQYAWKPVIIKDTVDEYGVVLWLDSGDSVGWTKKGLHPNNVSAVFAHIAKEGFYSPSSRGTMRQWTHPTMLDQLGINPTATYLDTSPCNGAYVGFARNTPAYHQILVPWYKCAVDQDCIAPQGSNRSNHRQDQAALSLLAYDRGFTCFPQCIESCGGVRLHNDGLRRTKVLCNAMRKRYNSNAHTSR